jgi:hypothetical protein
MEHSKEIEIRQVEYGDWPNCYRLANDVMELIVTTDVGPRVIRCGFVGAENEFKEFPEHFGKTGGKDWRIYGGHRLWHAPEHKVRTYCLDNSSVKLEQRDGAVHLTQTVEATTGIQKEIEVRLAPDVAHATVTHRLRNVNSEPVTLAPWALTVMAPGGTAIMPLPERGSHPEDLLPGNLLTLWKYTDMSDARWTWGRRYILLRQDSTPKIKPQKIGATIPDGWIAYARGGRLFLKTFGHDPSAIYPDMGCSMEVFTNEEMLELETLGPVTQLAANGVVDHVEDWWLFRDVPVPHSDADVEAHIAPRVKTALGLQAKHALGKC